MRRHFILKKVIVYKCITLKPLHHPKMLYDNQSEYIKLLSEQ